MRTVGIIAEYNPFHTGHIYHIQKAKELSDADYAVVVMSPDFVQRGEPAIFDKYVRAYMALQNGADLVVELPVCYATGSAEYFAAGGVNVLDRLGVIDTLCFGAENADVESFLRIAAILSDEPAAYSEHLRMLLRQGKTYPQARAEALSQCLPNVFNPDIAGFLGEPNNILGVEYCKALLKFKSSIQPIPVQRKGRRHGSNMPGDICCSAAALRKSIICGTCDEIRDDIAGYLPENCRSLFLHAVQNTVTPEELLPFLTQKLLSCDSYDSFFDISTDLSDRIRKLRFKCIGKTYEQIIALLKTRQITAAHVRRALVHLILELKADEVRAHCASDAIAYVRVLGLRRDAAPLLHKIRRTCQIPFITRPSRTAAYLTDHHAACMWRQDLFASHLYRSMQTGLSHTDFRTEYEISPLVI